MAALRPLEFSISSGQWMNKDFRHETKYLGRMRACVSHNKTPRAVWLIDNRNFFLTVVDAGSPRSGAQHSGVLGALSWVVEAACLFSHMAERELASSLASSLKGTNPIRVGSTLLS